MNKMKYNIDSDLEKAINNVLIIIGSILLGTATGSINVGLGIWFVAFALLPSN